MTLKGMLAAKNIRRALIVDDVCDRVPKASDIVDGEEVWPTFNDDLSKADRRLIAGEFAAAEETSFDQLIRTDGYVAAVWHLRDRLGEAAAKVFATYNSDQAADDKYVELARQRLEAAGLQCETAGRDFHDAAQSADVIVIDLFFGTAQDDEALGGSKAALKAAIGPRAARPPLIILMSRSNRLEQKRDEFRDDAGLLDSGFRIIKKSDLADTDRLELQLERLAENLEDTQRLAAFFQAVEDGLEAAAARTLGQLRKLKLSDVGQIQQLVLSAEGEPPGSYLVDTFDRVLQHEIEGDEGIIRAAINLNTFEAASHPPPYLAGSADLQEIVDRLLSQNERRLALPGSIGSAVTFGDLLQLPAKAPAVQTASGSPVPGAGPDNVMLVITPACDLQRSAAPRVLMLIGDLRDLSANDWSYGDDARTPSIRIGGELRWIKWNLKNITTTTGETLAATLKDGRLRIVGRLREAHALEIQQRVLSGLGRVGVMAALPATFPVELEVYYADLDGRPALLKIPQLADGAVCWVGRDSEGDPLLRLVTTEGICDGILAAIQTLKPDEIAPLARTAFGHVTSTADLRRMLARGIDLKNVGSTDWRHLKSETGGKDIPNMGLIAWNYELGDKCIEKRDLNKAGIILLMKDAADARARSIAKTVRAGFAADINQTSPEATTGVAGQQQPNIVGDGDAAEDQNA